MIRHSTPSLMLTIDLFVTIARLGLGLPPLNLSGIL